MRAKQSFLVLCLVAVVVAVGIGVVAFRTADSHRDAMLGALQRGMERAYDEAVSGTPRPEPQKPFPLPTEALRRVLLNAQEKRAVLPSFVNSQNVFLPRESVSIPSDELVCVVRLDNDRLYGITGKRSWRAIGPSEFERWPHEPLSTSPSAPQ